MKKKLLLTAGIIAMMTGCASQPQLDVNNVSQSKQDKKEVNINKIQQKKEDIISQEPTQTDLSDNTVVKVSENSIPQNSLNQQLGAALSAEVIHFDFDKYNIRSDQMPIVQRVADLLKNSKGNFTVRIEGNCDEWGSDEYNYALGLKRAKTLKQALVDLGVDENKLTIISYGESNPVCTAHTKSCWAKNRRDNFTLLP